MKFNEYFLQIINEFITYQMSPFWLLPDGRLISANGSHENWVVQNIKLTPDEEALTDKYGHNGLYYVMGKRGYIRVFVSPEIIGYSPKIKIGTQIVTFKLNAAQQATLLSKQRETGKDLIAEKVEINSDI